jgi:hypothetical protein
MPKTTKNGKERKTYLDYKDLYIAKSYLKHLKKWNSVKHIFTKLRPGVVKNSFIDGKIVCEIAKDTEVFCLTDTMPKMWAGKVDQYIKWPEEYDPDYPPDDYVIEIVKWYPKNTTYAPEHSLTTDNQAGPNKDPRIKEGGVNYDTNLYYALGFAYVNEKAMYEYMESTKYDPTLTPEHEYPFTSKRVYENLKKGQKVTIFFYKEFWIFMTEDEASYEYPLKDGELLSNEEVVARVISEGRSGRPEITLSGYTI